MIPLGQHRDRLGLRLDRGTAECLLSGRLDPDDAPPAYAGVARLIRALNAPPSPRELALETAAVGAAVRVLRQPPSNLAPLLGTGRRTARARRFGVVAVATALLTTGAAAADLLPERPREVVADALSVIARDARETTTRSDERVGIEPPVSIGAQIAQLATSTNAEGVHKGALISRAASDGRSRAGDRGRPAEARERGSGANPTVGRDNGPPKDAVGSTIASDAHGSGNAPAEWLGSGSPSNQRNGPASGHP